MIVKIDFLNKIKEFGLNSYESKIWCALLSKGVSTAGELSDIATVPRSRAYDVLESLEKKGFIITKLGKPFKYLAVSPNEIIERVKRNVKDMAEKEIKSLDDIKTGEFIEELSLLHSQGIETLDFTDISGYIKSRLSLYHHINNMVNNAKSEIVISCSAEELFNTYKNIFNSLKEAKIRNINTNIFVFGELENSKIEKYKEVANIKKSSYLHRFTMVDNKQILMMLQSDNEIHPAYDTGIWVDSSFLVKSVSEMFKNSWEKSKDL